MVLLINRPILCEDVARPLCWLADVADIYRHTDHIILTNASPDMINFICCHVPNDEALTLSKEGMRRKLQMIVHMHKTQVEFRKVAIFLLLVLKHLKSLVPDFDIENVIGPFLFRTYLANPSISRLAVVEYLAWKKKTPKEQWYRFPKSYLLNQI